MFSYQERLKAVQLYFQYDRCLSQVVRELGYPSESGLLKWCREYEKTGDLHRHYRVPTKFTVEQKQAVVAYYLEHGRSVTRAIRAMGYPTLPTLTKWIDELAPGERKARKQRVSMVQFSSEQKKDAVVELCVREGPAALVAATFGTTRSNLYKWKKDLLGGEGKGVSKECSSATAQIKDKPDGETDLDTEKQTLIQQVNELKREIHRLQLERDILEKADEILKKDQGINQKTLTNREKAVLIDALRSKYRLNELLAAMDMAKSSYCYQQQALSRPDKYAALRVEVKEIFTQARGCYGYRRIHATARRAGTCVSEKVIRRIMREDQLSAYRPKRRGYSSYVGEISPEIENVINRDFSADTPNAKWLTDITEFNISAGKVYLSPIVDCFDGMAVSWTISTSPDAEMVNSMLDAAVSLLSEDEHPIIHSDRGGHYRWPGWIERMQKAELTRSMSKKGCSPDNAACEGFFGRLKNEMFYGRSWSGVSLDDFMYTLDSYLKWYNEKRIKMSLGAKSPLEYRQSLNLTQ